MAANLSFLNLSLVRLDLTLSIDSRLIPELPRYHKAFKATPGLPDKASFRWLTVAKIETGTFLQLLWYHL